MKRPAVWSGHGDLADSLVLIVPLLLAYQVGVLFAGHVSGADVVTRAVYGTLGRTSYLGLQAMIACAFLVWIRRTQRGQVLSLEVVGPIVFEAAVYALTLGALISLVIDRMLGLNLTGGHVINALGAGVYEELVFRLGLFGGAVALLSRQPSRVIVVVALIASSIVFSTAHHVGAHGEPWNLNVFAFRCLAGVVFGLIFWFRSLAHAVYAHTLYDLLVYSRLL
ncbi:MAG: CPBP family intramembrane glutamic endopeptidase [Kofleriaceae bacterium]